MGGGGVTNILPRYLQKFMTPYSKENDGPLNTLIESLWNECTNDRNCVVIFFLILPHIFTGSTGGWVCCMRKKTHQSRISWAPWLPVWGSVIPSLYTWSIQNGHMYHRYWNIVSIHDMSKMSHVSLMIFQCKLFHLFILKGRGTPHQNGTCVPSFFFPFFFLFEFPK